MSDPARVFENIRVLLSEGQFPGKFAAVVQEAIEFVSAMSAQIERNDNGQAGISTGEGFGAATDPAGVVGSEVVPS